MVGIFWLVMGNDLSNQGIRVGMFWFNPLSDVENNRKQRFNHRLVYSSDQLKYRQFLQRRVLKIPCIRETHCRLNGWCWLQLLIWCWFRFSSGLTPVSNNYLLTSVFWSLQIVDGCTTKCDTENVCTVLISRCYFTFTFPLPMFGSPLWLWLKATSDERDI